MHTMVEVCHVALPLFKKLSNSREKPKKLSYEDFLNYNSILAEEANQ